MLGEREFLWFVAADDEFFAPPGPGNALRILSPDGTFYAQLHLGQRDPERSHLSLNADVGGRMLSGFFRCPTFDMDAVTPRAVRTVIEWVLDPSTVWLPVNYLGYPWDGAQPRGRSAVAPSRPAHARAQGGRNSAFPSGGPRPRRRREGSPGR
jgi:hypothetical protein